MTDKHCECGTDHICRECIRDADLQGSYTVGSEEFMRAAKAAGLLAPCTRCGERDGYYHITQEPAR